MKKLLAILVGAITTTTAEKGSGEEEVEEGKKYCIYNSSRGYSNNTYFNCNCNCN
jgi:hypothetical protein